jgi:hypothetical protein
MLDLLRTGPTNGSPEGVNARLRALACCLAAMVVALGSAGCAGKAVRNRGVISELIKVMPGSYDNLAQVRGEGGADAAAPAAAGAAQTAPGATAHLPLRLLIMHLQAPVLGRDVLYVRESSATDARRIVAQRLWSLVQDQKGEVVQITYLFKEPVRWQRAADEPSLLQSLVPDDLLALVGCPLVWSKTDSTFEANTVKAACQPGAEAEGSLVEQHAMLSADQLTLTEQQAGGSGRVATSADPASVYRFERSAGRL